jgi:type 1 glutamine amidotransferase
VAWIKTYAGARVFMTTMGHVMDFKNEGFRRLMVNACYWAMGMEKHISPASNVDLVGEFSPSPIGLKP